MANLINPGTFHPRRVNQYVAKMQYASDVNFNGSTRVDFGSPGVGASNNIVNARDISAAVTVDLTGLAAIDAIYGRSLVFTGSANVVAGTSITVRGFDYLNQPMSEVVTTVAGVTPIQGIRAFKYLSSVTFALNTGTAPVTMSIGLSNKLGLPYRAIGQRLEVANGAPVATQGTFVAGPNAQTTNAVGQADPRGTYQPNTALSVNTRLSAHFDFANDIFGAIGSEAGGLMGFPHAG